MNDQKPLAYNMGMKVIMLKDVGGVGRRGEVKDVSDGFAMNRLIPNGQAAQATKDKLASYEKDRAAEEAAKQKQAEALGKNVATLNGARIEIKVRATEKGGLFKSIGKGEVLKAILDQKNISVADSMVHLDKPIKTTGEHPVKLSSGETKSEITVAILAT